MTTWVAGVDFSTHAVDVVLVDADGSEPPQWHRVNLKGHDAFERTRYVHVHVPNWDDILAVGIEDPRGHNAGVLFRVQGAVLRDIPQDTLVVPWIPSAWRKAVGLKGNCTKSDVRDYVSRTEREEIVLWAQDACDAYCIALATRGAITVWEEAA